MEKIKIHVPLVGKLAVKHNFISKDQLKRALKICEETTHEGQHVSLPEVLLRTKIVQPLEMKKLHTLTQEYERKHGASTWDETAVSVIVSKNKLLAELMIPKNPTTPPDLTEIISMIKAKGIKHGLVKKATIESYINNTDAHGKPMIIARGTPVFPGEPPSIEYHFNTDYYRDATLKPGDPVRDKPAKPPAFVEEGDLLMAKKPMIPPDSGIDVFGMDISAEPFEDVILRTGEGSEYYEQELKIIAALSGNPFYSIDGRTHVFSEKKINGDFNIISGPLEGPCSLKVSGIITGEYHIRGGSITANEIRGATIDAIGDIDVRIGIIDSTIRCQGDVRARYIHSSVIETCGSVISEKEIIDSKIYTSGLCKSKTSKIIASVIAAKNGIEAVGIGTQTSVPCEIMMGKDINKEKRLERIDDALQQNANKKDELQDSALELREQQQEVNHHIAEKMDYHKQLQTAVASIDNSIALLQLKEAHKELAKAKRNLLELKKKTIANSNILKSLSDELKETTQKAKKIPVLISDINNDSKALELDKLCIQKWGKNGVEKPVLYVRGDIASGTIISGENTTKEVKSPLTGIIATEVPVSGSEPVEWQFKINKIKG